MRVDFPRLTWLPFPNKLMENSFVFHILDFQSFAIRCRVAHESSGKLLHDWKVDCERSCVWEINIFNFYANAFLDNELELDYYLLFVSPFCGYYIYGQEIRLVWMVLYAGWLFNEIDGKVVLSFSFWIVFCNVFLGWYHLYWIFLTFLYFLIF